MQNNKDLFKKYDLILSAKGYDEQVLEFFPQWDFVKDEIVIQERKTGSGNGTIHVFLGGNNVDVLRKTYPGYFQKYDGGTSTDSDCPKVKHFINISNLLSIVSHTYHHLVKKGTITQDQLNIDNYIRKLSSYKEGEFLEFESLFKMATNNRPYFKQFSGSTFNDLVRLLFIPDVSSYLLKLYKNSTNGETACFWLLGHKDLDEALVELTKFDDPGENISDKPIGPLNQILYGPPGTGKTFNAIPKALEIVNPKFFVHLKGKEIYSKEEWKNLKREFDVLCNTKRIGFVTFHQSISYEDFIEGIKPEIIESKEGISEMIYDVQDGVFKKICLEAYDNYYASKNTGDTNFEWAFEKLREDLAKNDDGIKIKMKTEGKDYTIFDIGDRSIRFEKASGGRGHTLSINTLREIFYNKRVPKTVGVGIYYPGLVDKLKSYSLSDKSKVEKQNYVLIIDEINRGNVSAIFGELITLLEETKRIDANEELWITLPYSKETFCIPPNLYIIGTMNTADRSVEALDTALRRRFSFFECPAKPDFLTQTLPKINVTYNELLSKINKRIEKLVDRDHVIGHAYFMQLEQNDIVALKRTFKNKILPLLQEYFYGDYGKIGLVLGKGFFAVDEDLDAPGSTFAEFEYSEKGNLERREVYHLKDLEKIDDDEFLEALKTLMGK